ETPLLPRGPACARRARVRIAAVQRDRDQWHVLPPATTRELFVVARADAGGIPLRGEGKPLHHTHEAAARCAGAARELLCFGRAPPRGEARSDALAVLRSDALRPRTLRAVSLTAAARHCRCIAPRTQA